LSTPHASAAQHPVILFDGLCNLCTWSVQFVIRRDPGGVFRFAALGSEIGLELLGRSAPGVVADSVVLIEDGRAHTRSTAALGIARRLRWPWPVLYALIIIPRPLRDALYAWIARNRYRWFGRRESCMVPTPELRERFLP
jgi:predicted DCC family thiol-disulfide oxidoreductase YuxK